MTRLGHRPGEVLTRLSAPENENFDFFSVRHGPVSFAWIRTRLGTVGVEPRRRAAVQECFPAISISLLRGQLQLAHEVDQVVLFLSGEFELLDQVEKLDGVFERQQPAVVEIGR